MIHWAGRTFLEPQVSGVTKLLAALESGEKRIVYVSPTGTGKTLMAGYCIDTLRQQGKRVDLQTYRRLLLTQLSGEMDKFGIPHGIKASGMEAHADASQLVQLVMTQTELSKSKRRAGYNRDLPNVMFLDEAHNQLGGESGEALKRMIADGMALVNVTATPVGITTDHGTMLIEAGKNSEFRKLGLLLPCYVYGPDEPAAALKLKPTKTGEFREGDVVKAIMSPTIFGRVLEWYQRLNPDRLPAILFAPGVKESIWFAEQFTEAGVRSAHIDGDKVWIDGETHNKTQELVNEIKKESETGLIKVVSNRYVMREGLDWPHLYHAILATVFGSLTGYLQCLDENTEILTRRGFVTCDAFLHDDEVAAFDCSTGEITWQPTLGSVVRSLRPDEKMFAVNGPSIDIRVTGDHRMVCKLRTTGENRQWRWPDTWSIKQCDDLSRNYSFLLPMSGVEKCGGLDLSDNDLRFIGWFITDGTLNKRNHQVVITQAAHQPQLSDLRDCLRGCGFDFKEYIHTPKGCFDNGQTQIRFSIPKGTQTKTQARNGWGRLSQYLDKTLGAAFETISEHQFDVLLEAIHLGDGAKQRGQAWTRRSYHITTGRREFADRLQSLAVRRGYRANIAVCKARPGGIARNDSFVVHLKKTSSITLGGASRKARTVLKESPVVIGERVWCVENSIGTLVIRRNGKVAIVGNSVGRLLRAHPSYNRVILQDHGGNWHLHGSPNADRVWTLGWDENRYAQERQQALREKKEPEPIVCPKCGAVRLAGPTCITCGHTSDRKGRMVVQTDGTLKFVSGDIYKERKVVQRDNTEKLWTSCYFRCLKARSPMTFKQAEAFFFRENGYWPPKNLPFMPKNAVDWYAKIGDVSRSDLVSRGR